MDIVTIENIFTGRNANPEGEYKKYSILIPFIKTGDDIHLIFEVRSKNLKSQPGEICFPGGALEGEESFEDCAIRETCEELNLSPDNIQLIGKCDYIVTPFNLILYPFVGIIKGVDKDEIKYNENEVESIFSVPLKFFLNTPPQEYLIRTTLEIPHNFPYDKIQGGKSYNWKRGEYKILFYEYGDYIIWGMTARIINNLVDIIKGKI